MIKRTYFPYTRPQTYVRKRKRRKTLSCTATIYKFNEIKIIVHSRQKRCLLLSRILLRKNRNSLWTFHKNLNRWRDTTHIIMLNRRKQGLCKRKWVTKGTSNIRITYQEKNSNANTTQHSMVFGIYKNQNNKKQKNNN